MSIFAKSRDSVARSWVMKIFIPITTIFLIIMILLAVVFSTLFTDVAQSLIVDDFLTSLRMVSTIYRQMRFNTVPIIADLYDAPEIRDYLLQKLPIEQATIGVYNRIDNVVARNSYIHSIYLYNSEYGFYSSLNGLESLEQLSDSTLLSFLSQKPRNMHLYQRQSVFTNKAASFSLSKEVDSHTNLYTICKNTYDEYGQLSSGIIMNLSETMARSMLASDDTDTLKNFYMIDEDFYIISHPDPQQFGKRATAHPLLGQIVLFDEGKGSQVIKDEHNDNFLACWYDVKEMNSHIQEPLVRLRWNLVLVFIGLAVIASLLLIWESKRVNNQLTRENRFIDYLKGSAGSDVLPVYAESSFYMVILHRQGQTRSQALLDRQRFMSFVAGYLTLDAKRSFLLPVEQGLYVYLSMQQQNFVSQLKKLRLNLYDEAAEQLSVLYTQEMLVFENLPQQYDSIRKSILSQTLVSAGFVEPFKQLETKEVNFFLSETADIGKALMQKSTELYQKAVLTMMERLKNQEDYDLFCSMKRYLSYSIFGLAGDVFKATDLMTAQEWRNLVLESRSYEELDQSLRKICELLEDYRQQSSKRHSFELVQRIKLLVKEYLYDVNLSSTFIADKIELSLGYTRNLFKSHEGIALNDYIGTRRIEEACTLLASSKQSINAVRESLGFSNTSYFCTYFKKLKGMSPSEYRRKERA